MYTVSAGWFKLLCRVCLFTTVSILDESWHIFLFDYVLTYVMFLHFVQLNISLVKCQVNCSTCALALYAGLHTLWPKIKPESYITVTCCFHYCLGRKSSALPVFLVISFLTGFCAQHQVKHFILIDTSNHMLISTFSGPQGTTSHTAWVNEQNLTSHSTHNRSFQRRAFPGNTSVPIIFRLIFQTITIAQMLSPKCEGTFLH